MQRGRDWASRWGLKAVTPLSGGAPRLEGNGDDDDATLHEFVYGRVSADSDDDAVDIYGAHPPQAVGLTRHEQGQEAPSTGDSGPLAAASRPPRQGSGQGPRSGSSTGATAGGPSTSAPASAAHAAGVNDPEKSLAAEGSFSDLAGRPLHEQPRGQGQPLTAQLTEEQRLFGERLAAEVEQDLKSKIAGKAAGGDQRDSSEDGSSPGAQPSGSNPRGDDSDDDEGQGHSHERRELLIFALPLARNKIAFLPVVPWCSEPEPERRRQRAGGLRGLIQGRIAAAADEAMDLWESMKAADEGTIKNKLYRMGQRMLDSVPAEERLMRGLPRAISRVLIFHPSRVSADQLMNQMSTMTTAYGLKAVGRAAAATVLLPLAVGIDLIILPGPQVLTYYTTWQLWRNASGVVGTRRAAYVTQATNNADIRVSYIADTRLDRAYEAVLSSRDGVLPEEEIDALVAGLKEPSLEEPLRELRRQRLRKAARTAEDDAGDYVALPERDPHSLGGAAEDGEDVEGAGAAGASSDEAAAEGEAAGGTVGSS